MRIRPHLSGRFQFLEKYTSPGHLAPPFLSGTPSVVPGRRLCVLWAPMGSQAVPKVATETPLIDYAAFLCASSLAIRTGPRTYRPDHSHT